MKMEFVDEAELNPEEEMTEEERGKIVLVGEPMGLFIAEETGVSVGVREHTTL